jgi:hypothetical protein
MTNMPISHLMGPTLNLILGFASLAVELFAHSCYLVFETPGHIHTLVSLHLYLQETPSDFQRDES